MNTFYALRHRPIRFLILFFLLWKGACLSVHADTTPVSAMPAVSTPTASAIPLEEVPAQADSAYASLNAMNTELASNRATQMISKQLPLLTRDINARLEETSKLLAANPSLEQLRRLEFTWHELERNFDEWLRDIARRAGQLEKAAGLLSQLEDTWQQTLQLAENPETPAPILQSVQNVVASIAQMRARLEKERHQNLVLQGRVSQEDARVDRQIDAVRRAHQEALDHLFARDNPPIWKAGVSSSSSKSAAARDGQSSLVTQLKGLGAYAERQAHKFFIHVVILLALVLALSWMRSRLVRAGTADHPSAAGVAHVLDVPVATALVLSLLASLWIYPQAPRLLWALWGAAALIPTIIIVRRLMAPPISPILNALVVFYAIDQVRDVAAVLPQVSRSLFLTEMFGGMLFLAWRWRINRAALPANDSPSRVIRIVVPVAFVLFATAFFAEALGFTNLSTLLGNAVLRSADLAILLYALIRTLEAFLAFGLHVGPIARLRVVQQNYAMWEKRIGALFCLIAWGAWAASTLEQLALRAPLFSAVHAALTYGITIGSFTITLGNLVGFALTLWGALLVSRFARFILEEDVYPRFHLAPGLPYAISTLLNYCILMIGFFLAVAALGFDMTKFTILAGAFGVGVGFGTQNIINNFVSGLILLFERPIKVGDVIQIDDATGTVQRIGIRATVIRTANGSEVVVPNGSLISGRVTNWTSISGQRSIEMPVTVAAGADPRHVMELLKSVAAADPRIAKDPPPQAFFLKYNPGSLDFELRAWTNEVNHITLIRSDLALALNMALLKENLAVK
jgi:potassium-dependent mechanosensitive channel